MLDAVCDQLLAWLEAQPALSAADALERLRGLHPDRFGADHLRTVQRFMKVRRAMMAREVLLGRAHAGRRAAFLGQLRPVLAAAQRDRHTLVYLDEAHVRQDADLGHGWAERGRRFHVASSSPGLSARMSSYGLCLFNGGQVRVWPYPRADGEHAIDVLRRLRAEVPGDALTLIWDGTPCHRAKAVWPKPPASVSRCCRYQATVPT